MKFTVNFNSIKVNKSLAMSSLRKVKKNILGKLCLLICNALSFKSSGVTEMSSDI